MLAWQDDLAKAVAIRDFNICLTLCSPIKQLVAEPSISRSRLRHWLTPPLRHPYSGRSSKPLPVPIFVLGQCIVRGGFAQILIGGLFICRNFRSAPGRIRTSDSRFRKSNQSVYRG